MVHYDRSSRESTTSSPMPKTPDQLHPPILFPDTQRSVADSIEAQDGVGMAPSLSTDQLHEKISMLLSRGAELRLQTEMIETAIHNEASCPTCRRVMVVGYWIPFCEHVLCYECLRDTFIVELRRRTTICDRVPKQICNITRHSSAAKILRLSHTIEHYSSRLSYPCPVCTIRTYDPPVQLRSITNILLPLLTTNGGVADTLGSWEPFFPSHIL